MVELDRGDMEQFANYHTGYKGNGKRSAWATFVSWDKLLLVLVLVSLLSALAALYVLLTPVLDFIFDFMGLHYTGWIEWESWILDGERGLIIAAALGLTALLFALLARFRVRRNYSVYAEAGCPQCHEHELIRVRRNRRDRMLSFFGLPMRRYSCRNCTWHGVRLAGYRYGKKADKIEELEIDAFEVEDGNVEILVEPIDQALPAAEILTAPVLAAETMVMEEYAEDSAEIDPVEPADQSIMEQPLAAEQSFEFTEASVVERAAFEEVLVSDLPADDAVEDAELDSELSNEKNEDEPLLKQGEAYGEVQLELHEEPVESEEEAEPASEEDDDFARLCLEVAQAKK